MDTSNKSNQLEAQNEVGDHLLAFLTRGHLYPEDFNILLLVASTFIMITTTLIVIRSLKRNRFVNHSRLISQPTKTLNCSIFNDQIEDLSIKKIDDFNKPLSLKYKSTVIWDKLLRELHYAADKCYINKYADRCIELSYYYPQLVNAKFGSTGLTPFHRVCFHGQALLMQKMLKIGANPRLTTNVGENSICLASYYYLLKQRDVEAENMACLHILHRAGCRLEGNSVWYDVLLKMAVRARKKGLIEWLFINKKMRKSNQLERSISNPL